MKPKILVVVIAPLQSNLEVNKRAYESAFNQDYDNYSVMIHFKKPIKRPTPMEQTYCNCSENREEARKLALGSDAEFFAFKDWDVEWPENTLSSFMIQAKKRKTTVPMINGDGKEIPVGTEVPQIHVQGGWYPLYEHKTGKKTFFPCGVFTGDNVYSPFYEIEKSVVRTDCVGLGCAFISREVLEKIEFSCGLDIELKDFMGNKMLAGECLDFANKCYSLGYGIYMNGDIVCKHHKKRGFLRRFLNAN